MRASKAPTTIGDTSHARINGSLANGAGVDAIAVRERGERGGAREDDRGGDPGGFSRGD